MRWEADHTSGTHEWSVTWNQIRCTQHTATATSSMGCYQWQGMRQRAGRAAASRLLAGRAAAGRACAGVATAFRACCSVGRWKGRGVRRRTIEPRDVSCSRAAAGKGTEARGSQTSTMTTRAPTDDVCPGTVTLLAHQSATTSGAAQGFTWLRAAQGTARPLGCRSAARG